MTVVNIHGVKPPQQWHYLQAIAQNEPLTADAFLTNNHANLAKILRRTYDRANDRPVNISVTAMLWVGE